MQHGNMSVKLAMSWKYEISFTLEYEIHVKVRCKNVKCGYKIAQVNRLAQVIVT